ncbi:MAG: hypothetical protein L6R40_007794 [Gallowayella cf. fulva]|nr:MAG: hypothetical protein L6R40_007794 [Xanthomendoza cf. fulva]
MSFRHILPLLTFLLAHIFPTLAIPESGQLAFADLNKGWCYFCSNDGAPPVCNSQCESAISRLCIGDLTKGWTSIVGGCEVDYRPPVFDPRQGRIRPTRDQCLNTYSSMLNMCGKDASSDATKHDPKYCTSSGGGGTYGWNDDGSTMTGTARYKIIPPASNQCGQREASWHLATDLVEWNPTWITEEDQVIYDQNPPPMPDFPDPPAPNPLCKTKECTIFDKPYFVEKNKPNWQETRGYMRHSVKWQGWADDDDNSAASFKKALRERCGGREPYNFQAYKSGDNRTADFELPHTETNDLCWCIADAVYDASGGIKTERREWCEGAVTKTDSLEMNPVGSGGGAEGELRKRILEEVGPLFNVVR